MFLQVLYGYRALQVDTSMDVSHATRNSGTLHIEWYSLWAVSAMEKFLFGYFTAYSDFLLCVYLFLFGYFKCTQTFCWVYTFFGFLFRIWFNDEKAILQSWAMFSVWPHDLLSRQSTFILSFRQKMCQAWVCLLASLYQLQWLWSSFKVTGVWEGQNNSDHSVTKFLIDPDVSWNCCWNTEFVSTHSCLL